MKKCVLKAEFEKGYRIFFYQALNSEDRQLNQAYVKVYTKEESNEPLMICHQSKIIEVPEDVTLEENYGHMYPNIQFVRSHQEEYDNLQA